MQKNYVLLSYFKRMSSILENLRKVVPHEFGCSNNKSEDWIVTNLVVNTAVSTNIKKIK